MAYRFADPDRLGLSTPDGTWIPALPGNRDYDRILSHAVEIEAYVAPPSQRVLKRRNFLEALDRMPVGTGSALDAMNAAADASAKRKDRIYWQEEDAFIDSNPKLARLACAAGLDLAALFDLGDPSLQSI